MAIQAFCSSASILNTFCLDLGIDDLEGEQLSIAAATATTLAGIGALVYRHIPVYRAVSRVANWATNAIFHYGALHAHRNTPVADSLRLLSQASLSTPQNRAALIGNAEYAGIVSYGLRRLSGQNNLLTQPHFDTLITSGLGAERMARALCILSNAGLLQTNYNVLISSGANMQTIVNGLICLSEPVRSNLVTQANFDALIASRANAYQTAEAIVILESTGLLPQTTCNALVASGANACTLEGIRILSNANKNLLTPDNLAALVESGANAWAVADGICFLSDANEDLVTRENLALLVANGPNAREVADRLRFPNESDERVSERALAARQIAFANLMRECERRGSPEALLTIIQNAKPSRQLYEEARTLFPNLSISWDFHLSGGESNPYNGRIRLGRTMSMTKRLRVLLVELANLCNAHRFRALQEKIAAEKAAGKIVNPDADRAYAFEVESIEYENVQRASNVAFACIETAGWNSETDSGARCASFEHYCVAQQNIGHTEDYRQDFHQIMPRAAPAAVSTIANEPSKRPMDPVQKSSKEPRSKKSKTT